MQQQGSQELSSLDKLLLHPKSILAAFQTYLERSIYDQYPSRFYVQFKKINCLIYSIIIRSPLSTNWLIQTMESLFPQHESTPLSHKRYYNYLFFFCRCISTFQEIFIPKFFDKLVKMDVCLHIFTLLSFLLFSAGIDTTR